jgi:hypothetical protein
MHICPYACTLLPTAGSVLAKALGYGHQEFVKEHTCASDDTGERGFVSTVKGTSHILVRQGNDLACSMPAQPFPAQGLPGLEHFERVLALLKSTINEPEHVTSKVRPATDKGSLT